MESYVSTSPRFWKNAQLWNYWLQVDSIFGLKDLSGGLYEALVGLFGLEKGGTVVEVMTRIFFNFFCLTLKCEVS